MTISELFDQATADAGFKGCSFANLQEFNSFHDSFQFNEWPRNIILPYDTNGTITTNRKKKVIPLQGWALRRIPQDTNDWRSIKLEDEYIQPMRVLAEKFMMQMVNSDFTDTEVSDISFGTKPEYMFLHSHLFGVSWRLNWPITGKLC